MGDLKDLRVKPVPTWCINHSHVAGTKVIRIRITRQIKILHSRRRVRRIVRVASSVVPLIIGQRSARTAKEENLILGRRLQTW
jgi:hypothetical protein